MNGGSETQDTNQSQHNGENAEEKDKLEVASKKKWVNYFHVLRIYSVTVKWFK